MRVSLRLCIAISIALMLSQAFAQEIPAGTVLPVMLSTTLDSSRDKPEKEIKGELMQDVMLPSGGEIAQGAKIRGLVVDTSKTATGIAMVLRMTRVESKGRNIAIKVRLLAVASMLEVSQAQLPVNTNAASDSITNWVTRQIGGDVVKRGQGKVFSSTGVTGTWLQGSSVRIKLWPNPPEGCPAGLGYDDDQAVWLFSSAACGEYGLRGLKIDNSAPSTTGDILIRSNKKIKINGGSGWLLMVTH